jgi:hypothetical protein
MKILKTKFLKYDQDLFAYQQKVKQILGIEFPISYLKQGKVRAFFNAAGELVAGYVLITSGELRTLSSIPGKFHNLPCDQKSLTEVTALFIDKTVNSSIARTQFWFSFSHDLSSLTDKTHYIYAYDMEKTKLKKLYRLAKPIVLFEGRTLLLEGMSEVSEEAIEIAECSTIKYLPFYGMPVFLNRTFFKKPMQDLRYFLEAIRDIA